MNTILLFIGAMFGVQGASSTLAKVAGKLAENVAKNLAKKALTKGAIYPIVKKVAVAVGVRMTKQVFADGVASAIPLAGALLSGALSFLMFKPNCIKLQKTLRKYNLSDPAYYANFKDEAIVVDDATVVDASKP